VPASISCPGLGATPSVSANVYAADPASVRIATNPTRTMPTVNRVAAKLPARGPSASAAWREVSMWVMPSRLKGNGSCQRTSGRRELCRSRVLYQRATRLQALGVGTTHRHRARKAERGAALRTRLKELAANACGSVTGLASTTVGIAYEAWQPVPVFRKGGIQAF